jgi:hypothetical protein
VELAFKPFHQPWGDVGGPYVDVELAEVAEDLVVALDQAVSGFYGKRHRMGRV